MFWLCGTSEGVVLLGEHSTQVLFSPLAFLDFEPWDHSSGSRVGPGGLCNLAVIPRKQRLCWFLRGKCLACHYSSPPSPPSPPSPARPASCLAIRMHCHCGFFFSYVVFPNSFSDKAGEHWSLRPLMCRVSGAYTERRCRESMC